MPPNPSTTPSASTQPRTANQPSRQATRAVAIDPIRVLRQKWKAILIWAIGGVFFSGVFFVGSLYFYPVYSGQVVLRLRPQLGDAKQIFGEATTQEETVARLAQTEAQQMVMRSVLVNAVSNRDILKTKWHEYYLDENNQFDTEEAVDDLIREISSGHKRGTQFFALYWSAHVPGDVPIMLNTISETYLSELKAESARKFNEIKSVFVKKQGEIDGQIETSKSTIRRFIVESNIPSFAENSQQSQQGLQELQKFISETTMDLSLAKSQRGQIDAKLQGRLEASQDDVRKAEGDPALLQLMRDINDLAISMQSKKARFGPMHPEVRSGEQTLASALTQKEKVLDDIVKRDLSGQFKTISDRTGGLEDLLTKQTADFDIERKRVEGLASRISDLEAMKDRQDRLEEERGIIANTIGELDLARAREDSIPVSIAQRALTPREISFPNWKVVLPGVWFAFVAFGIGLIFLREFLDQRVRFASELAGLASGKVLGVIPDMADDESKPGKAEFVVRELPQSVLAENYRQVSTNLLKSLSDDVGGVVGVFSAMPESGVTTIISNLASSVKVVGKRVLVIDTNFRKPGVARMFGASEDALGLSDMLAGNAEFNNVIQTTSYGIDIINAGQGRMIELLNTSKMSEVMDMARQKYDVIFIDTAPAGIAAEAIVVANRVDASILVVRAMRDQRGLVTRLVGQLSAQKGKFVGAILNRPEQTAGGYYRKNAQVMVGYGASPPKAAPAAGAA